MFKRVWIPLLAASLAVCGFKGTAAKLNAKSNSPKDQPVTVGSAGSKGAYSTAKTGQLKAKRQAKKKRNKKKAVRAQQGKKVQR